jgi:hypothetical protein
MERERGPFENEIHELIRLKGLASPALLNFDATGQVPSLEDRMLQAERFAFILQEAIERVAREIDERRADS